MYIAENCHECAEVVRRLEEKGIELKIHNVDTGDIRPPIPTFAYPALFKEKILLAYGSDIVSYLAEKAGK